MTDSRVLRTREKVLTTTFELLGEAGVAGLSVDEVSARSGVAKTTIYRHWPTREALVLDACGHLDDDAPAVDTGSLTGDLAAVLAGLAGQLADARWPSVLPGIIDAAERDRSYAEVQHEIHSEHAAPLYEALRRAVDRGELSITVDRPLVVAAMLGPLVYRRWFSREPIDEAFIGRIVEAARTLAAAGA